MTNFRRRNLYWSAETDEKAVDLAWKNHQSVSAYLTHLVLKEAQKENPVPEQEAE